MLFFCFPDPPNSSIIVAPPQPHLRETFKMVSHSCAPVNRVMVMWQGGFNPVFLVWAGERMLHCLLSWVNLSPDF